MEATRDRFSPSGEESSRGKKMARTLNPCLTEDICVENSLHCPLNCVFKWKCLSKVWNSHLSSPSFIYNWIQNNNSADRPWNLFYKSESKCAIAHLASHSRLISNRFSFKFVCPDKETVSPLCSSNGLVLCAKRIKFAWHYYVCNPLTQESVSLSKPDVAHCNSVTCFTCEVSSVSTTYKVVLIVLPVEKRCDSYRYEIQVFASDVSQWKNYRIPSAQGVRWGLNNYESRVVVHGEVFYWMDKRERIIAFSETSVSALDLPDFAYEASNLVRCLGESEGMILYALIEKCESHLEFELSIWELNEENFHSLHKNVELHGLFTKMKRRLGRIFVNADWGDLVQVSFSPAIRNLILIGCKNYIWTYNINTEVCDELTNNYSDLRPPLVLKAMPTIVPPRP